MDEILNKLRELEGRIKSIEDSLKMRTKFERGSDLHVIRTEDLVFSRPWKEI